MARHRTPSPRRKYLPWLLPLLGLLAVGLLLAFLLKPGQEHRESDPPPAGKLTLLETYSLPAQDTLEEYKQAYGGSERACLKLYDTLSCDDKSTTSFAHDPARHLAVLTPGKGKLLVMLTDGRQVPCTIEEKKDGEGVAYGKTASCAWAEAKLVAPSPAQALPPAASSTAGRK